MNSRASNSLWVNILLYGLSLGLLTAALQFSRFHLLSISHAEEWYSALVAILFAVLGIWAGKKWRQKSYAADKAPDIGFEVNGLAVEKYGLTPRELEVLEQMALGLSNQEIADKIFVSLNTVKTHSSNLFSKLGVERRTQAIQKAKALGLIA